MSVDYFLKIKGIDGESQDDKHPNEIDVLSWSWGESQMGTMAGGGGGGAGKVNMQDFSFTMTMNKASPKLMLFCANGQHIDEATFIARKAAGDKQEEYLIIKFTDLLISSYQTGASSEVPIDSITLNFAKIEYEYKPQKTKGGGLDAGIKFGWDVKKNVKA